MKFFRALLIIAFTVAIGTGTPLAAGYDLQSSNQIHSNAMKQGYADGWNSFKKAKYLDKIPSAIDEVAFCIRDFLCLFGLELKRPR